MALPVRWADMESGDDDVPVVAPPAILLAEVGLACVLGSSLLLSSLVISVACLLFEVLLLCPYNMLVHSIAPFFCLCASTSKVQRIQRETMAYRFRLRRLVATDMTNFTRFTVMWRSGDTVELVKAKIQGRKGIPPASCRLIWWGHDVAGDRLLQEKSQVELGIALRGPNPDCIQMQFVDVRSFAIELTSDGGARATMTVAPSMLVSTLAARVSMLCGVPQRDVRLVFGTMPLVDDRTLSHYNIQNESVVVVRCRTHGGSLPPQPEVITVSSDEGDANSVSSSIDRLLHGDWEGQSSDTDDTASADSLVGFSCSDSGSGHEGYVFNHRRRLEVEEAARGLADDDFDSQATTLRMGEGDEVRSPSVAESLPEPAPKRHCSESVGYQIFIKTLTGQTIILFIEGSDTVRCVKLMVIGMMAWRSMLPTDLRIVFAGKQLEDHRTMESCMVKEGCALHLLLRLRGGVGGLDDPGDSMDDLDMSGPSSLDVPQAALSST